MTERIRAVERSMVEEIERRVKEENLSSKANPGGKDYSKMEKLLKDENTFDLNTWRTKSENGSLMKDIPLDQISDNPASKNRRRKNSGTDDGMLELWETAEQDCFGDGSLVSEAEKELGVDKLHPAKSITERTQDGKRRKILERLVSDAQKLNTLKMSVQDLKMKMETKKRGKKGDYNESETVKRQVDDVEEAVVKLGN
ncbi:NADPH-dependent diflavin oxidoreductase [Trifolium pratense]|uniref:NADPH-dependent diflavin oxidoreductase n=1 Tax=Trifolium pratense TaxID=57577 RepID=A0A2K3MMH4_TRIPR|nr:NADPH-dependent diflavin oxidoreductase [Trifolium pratense]